MGLTASAVVIPEQRDAFYAAAVAGLRALDARERVPRRFGPDADTRWTALRGALTDADRIDLLLRDAAVTWGAAFSPADVFDLFGLAPDEPFGPDWRSLGGGPARRALAEAGPQVSPVELAGMLGFQPQKVALPAFSASTRLAVAGGAALVAAAQVFAEDASLSWSDQVLTVATEPTTRQLAALLAIFTGSAAKTRMVRPNEDLRATLKSAGFTQIDTAVVSADAEPSCATFARLAAGVA